MQEICNLVYWVLWMDLECHLFEGFKLEITKWKSLKNTLNRVHTESDSGHEDVGCHIMFEIAMETHFNDTNINTFLGNLLSGHKQQTAR